METRSSILALFLILLAQPLSAQQSGDSADAKAYQISCRIVKMTLNAHEMHREPGDPPAGDDDFTAAGKACAQLEAALLSPDSAKTENATKELRPRLAVLGMAPTSPKEQFTAIEKKASGLSGEDLFVELPDLAKRAFNADEIERAEQYSKQMLQTAPQYSKEWSYGNAIFYGNLVLGRVALKRGDPKEAGKYLLAAGRTPGSPQLDSFGPNMTLAKELLEKGEMEMVQQYLDECRKFWKMGKQQLDEWSADVRDGKTPDFRANLNY